MFKPTDNILVAVSGGPDSVCLFHFLVKNFPDLRLGIIHINYQTRGADSEAEEDCVRSLGRKHDVPVFVGKFRLKKDSPGFEERARDLRYDYFAKIHSETGAKAVALAHHRDDVVETMLLNLGRGAGPRGLAGIPYKRDFVVRPFLDISRREVMAYLRTNKIDYRQDKSNYDISFRRNWVRHRLLPYLRQEVGPEIDSKLFEISQRYKVIADRIEQAARQKISTLKIDDNRYRLKEFLEQPLFLQGEIIRTLLGKTDISKRHVAEVISVLKNSEAGKYKEFKGVRIEKKTQIFFGIRSGKE